MANRLADALSLYLREHAENPVDWREWGEEAFEKARAEDKPIFLSVGYSSCHWCHVMAHESFEDEEVARVLNAGFVPVKVDREERPDVDSVYMTAVQALTGHGGWPMSVFLTPDGEPFFAGTYWPREERQGMPGFLRVLEAVGAAWRDDRDRVLETSRKVAEHLRAAQELEDGEERPDPAVADEAAATGVRAWDITYGGFGGAPKFPQPMTLDFLLAHAQRTNDDGSLRAALHTLGQMSRGGIHDQVGGGFHRYSVDLQWLVPHFEKMLYDNALLLRAYLHAWQVTGGARFRRVARQTADYLLRELRHARGGFCSATDADSEGEEGRFFTWTLEEFSEAVREAGEDPEVFAAFFGVTAEGNFRDPHVPDAPARNVLSEQGHLDEEADEPEGPAPGAEGEAGFGERLAQVRAALYERRAQRVPPALDDKVLTSWSGLALGALAEAGAALGEARYVAAAEQAAAFIAAELVVDGALHHAWTDAKGAAVPAFLEDVAYLAQGLLALYEADHDPRWLEWARALAADADARFAETVDGTPTGGYFTTAEDAESLVARPRELFDNATPAGSSVMADVHLRLAGLVGEPAHTAQAERILTAFQRRALQVPTGYGELLRALERWIAGPREVAIVGDPAEAATGELLAVYRRAWRPESVLAVGEAAQGEQVPLLAGRARVDGRPAAYVCRQFTCERPVSTPDELAAALGS